MTALRFREKPLAQWPSKASAEQTMLTWKRNTNSYEINQTISKDICGGGLSVRRSLCLACLKVALSVNKHHTLRHSRM